MNKSTVILVRHGESVGNINGLICGSLDVELTKKGKEQSILTGYELSKYPIDVIYTSPLTRAYTMAKSIAIKQLESTLIIKEKRLTEMDFGLAEGYTLEEYAKKTKHGDVAIQALEKFGYLRYIEGQETFLQVQGRYVRTIRRILSKNKPGSTICITGHGMAIASYMAYLKGISKENFKEVKFSKNAAITVLEYDYDLDKFTVVQDASVEHLK
ncbi:MAG: histidine phosphatase family protein [Clostridia bacterium]